MVCEACFEGVDECACCAGNCTCGVTICQACAEELCLEVSLEIEGEKVGPMDVEVCAAGRW